MAGELEPGQAREALVVAAARALRDGRLAGGIASLCLAGYGVMVSKASAVADGKIEVTVCDLQADSTAVGEGVGPYVDGALLAALAPLRQTAGLPAMNRKAHRKLRSIQGGRR